MLGPPQLPENDHVCEQVEQGDPFDDDLEKSSHDLASIISPLVLITKLLYVQAFHLIGCQLC